MTGIRKKTVAAARHTAGLERDRDWVLVNSCVVYTPAGLEKICAAMQLDSAALAWPAGDPAPDEADGEIEASAAAREGLPAAVALAIDQIRPIAAAVVHLHVVRLSRNPRVVICLEGDREVNVAVRDNRNFVRGMALKADRIGESQFRMVGHCPRWRGRY